MEKTKALDAARKLFGAFALFALGDPSAAGPADRGGRQCDAPLAWRPSFQDDAGEIIGVDLSNSWLTDADLESLARLPQLETINLSYTKITDPGLEHLRPSKTVKMLNLYYAEAVTDQGIAHLKHWQEPRTPESPRHQGH